ncbi:MAG: hypothetical protein COB97_04540 [Paracoccus sp.]|nr:MAG: hypothetical protein COB97_04540 [Paracoccus sp. (in: a-proteobacteria)]
MEEDRSLIHREIMTILNGASADKATLIRFLAKLQIFIDRNAAAWPEERIERLELAIQQGLQLRREGRVVPESIKTEIRFTLLDG